MIIPGTDRKMAVSVADLPRYDDLWKEFEAAQEEPAAKPLGLFQKLRLFAQNVADRLIGISTPSEYDTGREYILAQHGEKYRTTHVKDGQVLSETRTGIRTLRNKGGLHKNEVKSVRPFVPNGLQKGLSRHSFISEQGEKEEALTEGVTLPNGVSYARTQNFETGETEFRKNDKGLFWAWTFDRQNRLISAYEGRFGEINQPDRVCQTAYQYDEKGRLFSAIETQNTITPDGEKTEVIRHVVRGARERLGGRE